ncbi:hypothetical protein [Veillonella intestinalis]|uniref:hypothetical protein n=1 Tax=Veillonella intestinalis TaxID=2941341 RepID=UPI00203B3897|nr:hypothetical protein [Veillonella intestinalis]
MKHLIQPSSSVETTDTEPPTRRIRRILSIFIAVSIIGTIIYGIHDYLKAEEQEKVVAARSEMIKAQALANNLTLLSEERIKELTAINTGVSLNELSFKEIALIAFDDLPVPPQVRKGHARQSSTDKELMNDPDKMVIPGEEEGNVASLPPLKMPIKNEATHKSSIGNQGPLVDPVPEGTVTKEAAPTTTTNKAMPANDFSRTPPQEFQTHPFYQIKATRSGLTYELIIDGVNGHIIKSIVH